MRDLVNQYLSEGLSRRGFMQAMGNLGFTAAAAQAVLAPLRASLQSSGGSTAKGTGGDLLVAQIEAAGIEYVFTNPGSAEVGFWDAFVDRPALHLILGLHEGIVISMADGYNRVSGKPGLVGVHVIAGTAQASGQLYNASRDGSALVITAGLIDNEIWSDEVLLGPRPGFGQKELNRQFTKISWEARHARSLPLLLRRAIKVATTEPGGPVYLALAQSALQAKGETAEILPPERFVLRAPLRAPAVHLEQAARLVLAARHPLLVVGDAVWRGGAQAQLVSLVEKLALPVMNQPQGFANFPTQHKYYLGEFDVTNKYVQDRVDLLLVAGAPDFGAQTIPPRPEPSPAVKIVRLGVDSFAMSRNSPTDVAVLTDLAAGLADLQAAAESQVTAARLAALIAPREEQIRRVVQEGRSRQEADARTRRGRTSIDPDELGAVMARTLDQHAILVSESLTAKYEAFHFGYRENEQMLVTTTGLGLGWGVGASIGAKLAAPDRQVVCSIGDGALMYSASGFWTQVRYAIPILTVVWNNHNYQRVRQEFAEYQGRMAANGHYAGVYLGSPDIDFVKLAESQGVKGERVTSPRDIEPALRRGIRATQEGRPYLVEVVVARWGGGADSTWFDPFRLADRRKRRI